MQLIIHLFVSTIAVLLAGYLLPGVHLDGWVTALVVAIILGVVNTVIKPILTVLTLPITILTLGLFLIVINGLMVLLVAWLVPGFKVDGFWWALAFSILVSVVGSFLHQLEPKSVV